MKPTLTAFLTSTMAISWTSDYWRDYGHAYIGVKKKATDKRTGVFSVEKVDCPGNNPEDEAKVVLLGNAYFSPSVGWEPAYIKPVTSIRNGTMIPYPTLGVVNGEYFAKYITRRPYRQWCKGYASNLTTEHVFPSSIVCKLALPMKRGLDLPFLLSLYNPSMFTVSAAFDKIKNGELLSAGFSPDLQFYVTEHSGDNIYIGYKRFYIGYLKSLKQKAYIIKDAEFLSEDLAQLGLKCEYAT